MSQDFNAIPVYICFLGTAGVKDQYFTVIQMLVLAVSQQSALDGTTDEGLAFSKIAPLNVSASFDNGTITYVPGLNNQIDVASIPKLGFNLSFAIRIMNVPNPLTPGVFGDGITLGGDIGLTQPLRTPPEDCRGDDNIYLFRGAEGLRADYGTSFALVWTWHVVIFSLAIIIFLNMLYWNDFNRTLLRILAQDPDLTVVGWEKNRVVDEKHAPKLLILRASCPNTVARDEIMGAKDEVEDPLDPTPCETTTGSAVQVANVDTIRDLMLTMQNYEPSSDQAFETIKGKVEGVVVTNEDPSLPVQVITFDQLRHLLQIDALQVEPVPNDLVVDPVEDEESLPMIVQVGGQDAIVNLQQRRSAAVEMNRHAGNFEELKEFWESRKEDENV